MSLQHAIKYYLDFLKIDNPEDLEDVFDLKEFQAKKILNYANGLQPSYTDHAAFLIAKDIEAFAVLSGCPYHIDFPGKWRLRKADVLDILKLCGIKDVRKLTEKTRNSDLAYRIFCGKRPVQVTSHTLKRLCELTGSLPEELADKIVS